MVFSCVVLSYPELRLDDFIHSDFGEGCLTYLFQIDLSFKNLTTCEF